MPRSTGTILKEQGYDVKDVRDHGLRGAEDEEIYEFAKREGAVILTGDRGFGNIIRFALGDHYGIVIAHFPGGMTTAEINRQLLQRIKDIPEGDFKGNLIIIEPSTVRIKKKATH